MPCPWRRPPRGLVGTVGLSNMTSIMARSLAMCAALTAAGSGVAANHRDDECQLSRQEVVQWHALLYESTNALGAPGGGSSALRGWAIMSLAMFEASNAVTARFTPYRRRDYEAALLPADAEEVVQRVAVARAAQVVLDGLFAPPPSEPDSPLGPTRAFAHAQQFAIHVGAIDPTDPAFIKGVELGEQAGERILSERAVDGHPPPNPAVVNGSGWFQYQYGLPYFSGTPGAAGYATVRPFGVSAFGLEGGHVTFVAPPLPADSANFKAQWEETFSYGTSDTSRSRRTPETDAAAAFHDGNFGSQIGDAIDFLSSSPASGLPAGTELLRIIALTAMSCNDAHSNHWFWKYYYLFGRPVTQFRQVPLDQPDDLGKQRDGGWGGPEAMVLDTNQNPEHPSGHASRTAALTASFRAAFGDDMRFRTISFSQPAAPARIFETLTAFEEEVMASRTFGGVRRR